MPHDKRSPRRDSGWFDVETLALERAHDRAAEPVLRRHLSAVSTSVQSISFAMTTVSSPRSAAGTRVVAQPTSSAVRLR